MPSKESETRDGFREAARAEMASSRYVLPGGLLIAIGVAAALVAALGFEHPPMWWRRAPPQGPEKGPQLMLAEYPRNEPLR
jgi:hypothetical protein